MCIFYLCIDFTMIMCGYTFEDHSCVARIPHSSQTVHGTARRRMTAWRTAHAARSALRQSIALRRDTAWQLHSGQEGRGAEPSGRRHAAVRRPVGLRGATGP